MFNHLSFQTHGKADHTGGPAEQLDHLLVFIADLLDKSPGEVFRLILPGIGGLSNFHPLVVHFPIAFLVGFFVLDVFGAFSYKVHVRQVASWFLYLGTLSAALAVVLGLQAAGSVEHGENVHDIMERHETMGMNVLLLASILSVWRMGLKDLVCDFLNSIFMLLSTILIVLLCIQADLGGMMVYDYGVAIRGVQHDSSGHLHQQGGQQPLSIDVPQQPPEAIPSVETIENHEKVHGKVKK